jgi:hypothetical protein
MRYIDKYSWRSFLSTSAKNIEEKNGIYYWDINKRKQVLIDRALKNTDIQILKDILPFSFFYFQIEDVLLLKKHFSISKKRDPNIFIPTNTIENLKGRKTRGIRHSLNQCKNLDLSFKENFTDYNDVLKFINVWKYSCGNKYFQSRTGKDKFFFKNSYHKNCINTFLYDKDRLIGYSVLSPPNDKGYSSYVLRKTLCLEFVGLSNYIDIFTFKKGKDLGVKGISLGGGSKKVRNYKLKFPNAIECDTYDGKAISY